MDLASQESVRRAAAEILAGGKAGVVHGLVNNAGVMCVLPYQETVEGIELQFGIVSLLFSAVLGFYKNFENRIGGLIGDVGF